MPPAALRRCRATLPRRGRSSRRSAAARARRRRRRSGPSRRRMPSCPRRIPTRRDDPTPAPAGDRRRRTSRRTAGRPPPAAPSRSRCTRRRRRRAGRRRAARHLRRVRQARAPRRFPRRAWPRARPRRRPPVPRRRSSRPSVLVLMGDRRPAIGVGVEQKTLEHLSDTVVLAARRRPVRGGHGLGMAAAHGVTGARPEEHGHVVRHVTEGDDLLGSDAVLRGELGQGRGLADTRRGDLQHPARAVGVHRLGQALERRPSGREHVVRDTGLHPVEQLDDDGAAVEELLERTDGVRPRGRAVAGSPVPAGSRPSSPRRTRPRAPPAGRAAPPRGRWR